MKIAIVTIVLIVLTGYNLFAQTNSKSDLINYFDNAKSLDPIEGIWTVNVVGTLYSIDEKIGQDSEEFLSEWGIKRNDKLGFKVIDIGEGSRFDAKGDFEAFFESSAIDGFYTYKCNYTNPIWTAKTNAILTDKFIIEYDFFTSDEYVKKAYGNNYRQGLKLHWKFIWTKKYPKLNPSNDIEANKNEWAGNGTGFFISKDGYLATNYHVIEDATEIEVDLIQSGQKNSYKAKVISSDKQNDLAVIKIDDPKFKPYPKLPYNLKTQISDVGTNVFTLGYPMANIMGDEIKFTDGKISSKTGFQGDITTYQVSVPVQPGNSGGPLFDHDGNVVGVVNAKIMKADNVSYAIKTSYVKNLIDVFPETLILPTDNSLAAKPLTEKIKTLSDYVVLIKIR
jgi:S1-C subfamily serine protease